MYKDTMEHRHTLSSNYIVSIPDRVPILGVLISVDLLLAECPIRELPIMRPERYPRRYVYEAKITTLAPDGLAFVCTIEIKAEKRVVITRKVISRPRCNFLIGWHKR